MATCCCAGAEGKEPRNTRSRRTRTRTDFYALNEGTTTLMTRKVSPARLTHCLLLSLQLIRL